MMYDTNGYKFIIIGTLATAIIGAGGVFACEYKKPDSAKNHTLCYETDTYNLKSVQMVGLTNSGIYICGIRERSAMPSVYQCHIMNYKECSE